MSPKKIKKSKVSKQGSSKKKDTLTPKEEILNYQIQIKEDCLVNLKFELEKVKEDNDKITKKLEMFYLDKDHFSNEMIKKYHESIFNISEKPIYKKSDVVSSMKSNWAIERVEKQDILDLHRNIEIKDKKFRELENKLTSLQHIKNIQMNNNDQQIIVLKQILDDMDSTFLTIKAYLENTFMEKKVELLQKEQLCTKKFQKDACIKVSKIIKDDIKQEIIDNKWLINKLDVHRQSFEQLKLEIEKTESENVNINEKIFRLKQSDKKFNLFISEIEPEEILFKDGILEYDFNHVFKKSELKSKPTFHTELHKSHNIVTSENIEKNLDFSYSRWKDYLNLNPINFDFLYITGHLLNIHETGSKSDEEIVEDKFTTKSFSSNLQSLNKVILNDYW